MVADLPEPEHPTNTKGLIFIVNDIILYIYIINNEFYEKDSYHLI